MFTNTNRVQDDGEEREAEQCSSSDEYVFHRAGNRSMDPANVQVQIYSKQLTMEVDARAVLSTILEKERKAVFPDEKLQPSK